MRDDNKVALEAEQVSTVVDPLHNPPDIGDLAHRGGLPGNISTYRIGAVGPDLFIQASGNSTGTVSSCVILGFSKDVWDARAFCRQFSNLPVDVSLVRRQFSNLGWVSDEFLQSKIIDAREAGDENRIATELFLYLVSRVPRLRQWPPFELDDRPYAVKKGEIACRFLEELRHVNGMCRPRQLTVDELRNQSAELTFWVERDFMSGADRKDFDERFKDRGKWKADDLYDCVADLMNSGSGDTVKSWCKKFRAWKKTHP